MIHSGLELLVSDMYRTIFNNSRPKLKTRIAAGRLYMTDDFAKCHGRRRHLSVVAGIMAKANTGLPLRSDTRTGSKTKGYYEAWSDELFKKYPDQYPAFIMGKFVEVRDLSRHGNTILMLVATQDSGKRRIRTSQ